MHLERLAFLGLATIVAISPLPLGSARPLFWALLGAASALLLLLTLVVSIKAPLPRDLLPPALLFSATLAFIMVQTGTWTPASLHSEIWKIAAAAMGHPLTESISLDRHTSLVDLIKPLSYAAIFYVSYCLARSRANAAATTNLLVIAGGAYAAYGLVVYGFGNKTILWLDKWAYPLDLTSTFVNRNNFATYMGICILVTTIQIVRAFRNVIDFRGSWRDQVQTRVEFFSARAWIIVCLFLQMTALFLTHSRAGVLSTLIGGAALLVALAASSYRLRSSWKSWMTAPIVIVILAFLISGAGLVSRLTEANVAGDSRVAIFRATLQAIGDHPLTGTGLGSFQSIFPYYRPLAANAGLVNAAHDDYLETILDLGIPAASALFAAVAWLFGLCVHGIFRRRRDGIYPCLGIAASILVGCHSIVDFSLQVPAVAIAYVAILAVGVAQSRSQHASFTL